jgi:hypothetical protein
VACVSRERRQEPSSEGAAGLPPFKFLNMSPKAVRDWLTTLRDPLKLTDDFGSVFMNLEVLPLRRRWL